MELTQKYLFGMLVRLAFARSGLSLEFIVADLSLGLWEGKRMHSFVPINSNFTPHNSDGLCIIALDLDVKKDHERQKNINNTDHDI